MRALIISGVTGICSNAIEIDTIEGLELDDGYVFAPDTTGEIGWTWDGSRWRTPDEIWADAHLTGTPRATVPPPGSTDDQVATMYSVSDAITTALATFFTSADYISGDLDGTGANFTFDLDQGAFDGTGAGFGYDVDEGTY